MVQGSTANQMILGGSSATLTLPDYGRVARDTASELPRRADSRNQSLRNGSKNSQESELLQFAGHFEESDFERVRF
jgi:hypothetical protein